MFDLCVNFRALTQPHLAIDKNEDQALVYVPFPLTSISDGPTPAHPVPLPPFLVSRTGPSPPYASSPSTWCPSQRAFNLVYGKCCLHDSSSLGMGTMPVAYSSHIPHSSVYGAGTIIPSVTEETGVREVKSVSQDHATRSLPLNHAFLTPKPRCFRFVMPFPCLTHLCNLNSE